jgi:hypothetical protein
MDDQSPDAAPMDFDILSIFKRRLQKRKIYTLAGLKRAFKDEWENLEQLQRKPLSRTIINTMYGSHIEHLSH